MIRYAMRSDVPAAPAGGYQTADVVSDSGQIDRPFGRTHVQTIVHQVHAFRCAS